MPYVHLDEYELHREEVARARQADRTLADLVASQEQRGPAEVFLYCSEHLHFRTDRQVYRVTARRLIDGRYRCMGCGRIVPIVW